MGSGSNMVARSLYCSLRGAAGVALVLWTCLLHLVGLHAGQRGDMGSCISANASSFSLQSSPFSQCLVRGVGRATPDTKSLTAESFIAITASRSNSSGMDYLSSEQRLHDSCLAMESLCPASRPLHS